VIDILLLIGLGLLIAFVLVLPWWLSQRRRHLTSKLTHYQDVAEALLENNLSNAREGLKELIRTDTEDVAAYLRLARVLQREGDHERAIALYRNLRAREIPDRRQRLEVVSGLVEELYLTERYEEARAVVDELRQLDRQNPLIGQVELQDALGAEDWPRALKACDRLAKSTGALKGPRPVAARTFIARKMIEGGSLREARKVLESALAADASYAPALLLLGDLWNRQSEYQKAADSWTQLVRKHPQAAGTALGRLEKAYFEMGRFSELALVYDELATAPGGAPLVGLARARMALRRGQIDEGLSQVETLVEQHPDLHEAHDWHIFLLLEAGRHEDARSALKSRVEGGLTESGAFSCPSCNQAGQWEDVRCDRCGTWLPDPVG